MVNRRYEVTFQLTTPHYTHRDDVKEVIEESLRAKPVHLHGFKIRRL